MRMIPRQDKLACLALAALFALMLAATWQRWTRPFIDHGREMHLPTRLLEGERLYTDILYYYGPFAPNFNAFLYRIFGIHLATLQTSGIVCATLILAMIYWLARQLMSAWETALATSLVLLICAFNIHAGSYIQPYAYAALYGLVFALGALVCAVRYLQCRRSFWLGLAGASAGMVLICKPELGPLAVLPSVVAWILVSCSERRLHWNPALLYALPCAAISSATYGLILSHVSWQTLVMDNLLLFMQPQLVHFSRQLSGTLYWPRPAWEMIAAVGFWSFIIGLSSLLGLLVSRQRHKVGDGYVRRVWGVMLAGVFLWLLVATANFAYVNASPLKSAGLVLPAVIVGIGWRWLKAGANSLSNETKILMVISLFSLVAITRVFFNVPMKSPYTPFTVPSLVIVYLYLLFRLSPAWLLPTESIRRRARQCAMALIAVTVIGTMVNSALLARRRYSFEISTPRGRLFTEPAIGRPLAEAVRFVEKQTAPDDYLLSLPQGTSINFLTGRPYPLREESIMPGFVTGEKEADAIGRLDARRVSVVLLVNLPTPEYRDRVFGADYNQSFLRWISENYYLKSTFSNYRNGKLQYGGNEFFIYAYRLKK